jgi:hypothetical protein
VRVLPLSRYIWQLRVSMWIACQHLAMGSKTCAVQAAAAQPLPVWPAANVPADASTSRLRV